MTLTLRAVSLDDQPLTQPITARFDGQGGTIGRADHNTLALPDPERHISREQAEISAGRNGFVIRNVGSSNPITVRNRSLAHGESAPLAHNDQVRIGRYLLEVVDDGDATAIATTPVRTASELLALAREGDPSHASRPRAMAADAPLSPNNPFADLLAAPTPPAPAARAAPETPWPARLPDDFDPFAAPLATPLRAQPSAPAAGAFEDLIPSSASASIDQLFGLDAKAGGDPLAGFLADVKPRSAQADAGPGTITDPLVLFGALAQPAPPPEVAPDQSPELRAAFTPPRAARAMTRAAPEPAPVGSAASRGSPAGLPRPAGEAVGIGLWAAFCDGAGIRIDPQQGVTPEMMQLAGSLLRASVDGTLQLMAVRAATRHELHAQVTVIQARNNNPLKFSPDGQSALEQLLQPPVRGFLPGPAAVTEAMDDLVGHAIGTMAGMRSALEGVLGRFGPPALEQKLVGKSMLDSLLPMARRSKLWELYLQHYEGIREEAQEDFHALFGRAFLAAYEQQVERLRRERPAA